MLFTRKFGSRSRKLLGSGCFDARYKKRRERAQPQPPPNSTKTFLLQKPSIVQSISLQQCSEYTKSKASPCSDEQEKQPAPSRRDQYIHHQFIMSTSLPASSSTIRVFVQWKEQTVFAGEDIECQITFKNVAPPPTPRAPHPSTSTSNAFSPAARKSAHVKNGSPLNPHPSHQGKGHRSTLSLNVPAGPIRAPPASTSWSARNAATKSPRDGGQHKRSVSIISIGATESVPEDTASHHGSLVERPRNLSRGHGRSASLQIVPRGLGINGAPIPCKQCIYSGTMSVLILYSSVSALNCPAIPSFLLSLQYIRARSCTKTIKAAGRHCNCTQHSWDIECIIYTKKGFRF